MGKLDIRIDDIYEKHYQALYDFCLMYIHRDPRYVPCIDDAIQEAVLYVLRAKTAYENDFHVLNTMMKYCRTYFKDLNRKQRRRACITGRAVPIEYAYDLQNPVDAIARWCEQEDQKAWMTAFQNELTEKEKDVYDRCFHEGLNRREAADAMSISEESVKGTLQRIRKKAVLRKEMLFSLLIAVLVKGMHP